MLRRSFSNPSWTLFSRESTLTASSLQVPSLALLRHHPCMILMTKSYVRVIVNCAAGARPGRQGDSEALTQIASPLPLGRGRAGSHCWPSTSCSLYVPIPRSPAVDGE